MRARISGFYRRKENPLAKGTCRVFYEAGVDDARVSTFIQSLGKLVRP